MCTYNMNKVALKRFQWNCLLNKYYSKVLPHTKTANLQAQLAHPDANHNAGVLAVSVNKADVALSLLLPVGTGTTQLLH